MASATIVKFPDGRTETKNILTSFEKNGTNVIAFETDKVDNGHKVVGVSYLSDGMYQNIVDQNKWNEVKGYLVDILHDRMNNEEYRLVPEEVLVTADPYHPLGLRDENLDKIVSSYDAFKATKEQTTSVEESLVEAPVEEVVPTENVTIENETTIEPETISIMDAPVVESVENTEVSTPEISAMPIEDVAPIVQPEVVVEQVAEQETVKEEPILDPFAIADSLDPVTNAPDLEVHQDIVPPVGVDVVEPSIPEQTVMPTGEVAPVVQPEAVVEQDSVPEENVVAFPEPEMTVAPQEEVVQQSAVQNAYVSGVDAIINQMRETTEKYLNEINMLQENYIKEMEEMRSEISRNLEEAKGINELSKQTFDKAQSMSPIENEQALELTRVA